MRDNIIKFLQSHNLVDSVRLFDVHIHNNESIIKKIHDVINGNFININLNDVAEESNILNYYAGIYYHFELDDIDKAKEHYNLSTNIKNNFNIPHFHIARLFNKLEQYDECIEYYQYEIENNNCSKSMHNVANIYRKTDRMDLAIAYYLLSINNKNQKSMYFLGTLYQGMKMNVEAEKYYKMAASPPYSNKNAMCKLGKLYNTLNKKVLSEKYYLMSYEAGCDSALTYIEEMYKHNSLKLYHVLQKIKTKNGIVRMKIENMRKKRRIHCYENKIRFLSKVDECVICYDTKTLIPTECAHYHCKDCIVELTRCSQCNTRFT